MQRNPKFYDFSGGGGSGPPVPPLDPHMAQSDFIFALPILCWMPAYYIILYSLHYSKKVTK